MKKVMIASFEESAIQNSMSIDKIPKSTSTSGKAAHDGFVISSYPTSLYQSPFQSPNKLHSTPHSFYGNIVGTTLQETGELIKK